MDAKPRELYLLFRAYEVSVCVLATTCVTIERDVSIRSDVLYLQGYEGSLLKVTSKNGKTASVCIHVHV